MTRWPKVAGIVLGTGAAAVGGALAIGPRAWDRATAKVVARLRESSAASCALPERRYSPADLTGLPAPVARYFSFALTPGLPLVRRARLLQEGTFATARDRWAPFTAIEHFSVSPPAFVWDARIRVAPLLAAHVRDSYLAGEGVMHGAVAGLFAVVDQRGTPEMAASSLLRWLAEIPWLPTALLPAGGVRWEPAGERTARATLTDGPTTVAMDVHFGPAGEIARITALRHRDVNGTPILTPWEGRYEAYVRLGGMKVPSQAEVGWILDDEWVPYWRGRVVDAQYEPGS